MNSCWIITKILLTSFLLDAAVSLRLENTINERRFLQRRQATSNGGKLTVDPPQNPIIPDHLLPFPQAERENRIRQQQSGLFPSSISAGGSPQNPALFSRPIGSPQSPNPNRPSIAIAPSPVRPEIITVPLTTLTRQGAGPPLEPQPPAPAPSAAPPAPRQPVVKPDPPPAPSPAPPRPVINPSRPATAQPPVPRTAPPRPPSAPMTNRPAPIIKTVPQTTPTPPPTTRRTPTTTTQEPEDEEQPQIRVSYNNRPSYVSASGRTLLNPHNENYCDIRQFPDEVLVERKLQRVEYFVANLSCSRQFFECAVGQTYLLNCTGNDQVFDINTVICNFRSSVQSCPEYDKISHCTIKEQCTVDQFACCAMPQQCIPFSKRCDGVQDCADGEDENNCPSCESHEFPCVKTGKCISWSMHCNGVADECFDQTNLDEQNCQACSPDKFYCARTDSQQPMCLELSVRCDGLKDCPKGEDELNCKTKGPKVLLCEDQKLSVDKEQWCDGTEDCADGSDEKYCTYK